MIPLLTALLLATQQQGTPVVSAELEPSNARVGEAVILRVSVQTRGGSSPDIQPPTLPAGLDIVSTSDFTEVSLGTGGRSSTTRREWLLMPSSSGSFVIAPIQITIGRRAYRTQALRLQVSAAGPDVSAPDDDARVTVHMEPDTVYVGQQSTLVSEILLSPDLQMRLTRPPTYEAPAPSDFWIQELAAEPSSATDMRLIDGQRYIVTRFYRAYFPLTAGQFAFAPSRVTYEARQGFLYAPQTREMRSPSPHLTVLPVPESGRPNNFQGAVGELTMTAKVEPRNSAVGDAVSLIVELRGTGNIKAMPPPNLPRLSGFEVLDPAESSQLDTRTRKLGGVKRFSWVLVAEREGTFDLPAIEYSSFDPDLRTFRKHRADPGNVQVVPAGAPTASTIAGLRAQPDPARLGFVHSRYFLPAQVAPFVLLVFGFLARRRRSGPSYQVKRGWDQRLLALRAARTNPLTDAERLLRDALVEAVPTARARSGTRAELQQDLARSVSLDFAAAVGRLLEQLENARYAPAGALTADDRRRVLNDLEDLLDVAWKHLRSAPAQAAIMPFILLVTQAAGTHTRFDEGVISYRDQQYTAAVRSFEEYVRTAPQDAAGWYNLAMSYEAQRQPARATWALLHAHALQPRAVDVETQLIRLGATRLAERVRPLLRLNTEETWLVASGLWWFAALLLAVAIAKRKRRLAATALIPLLLAGTALIAWAIEHALPAPAIVLDRGASLLAGQSLHADVLRRLQPGSSLTIIEAGSGWTRVSTPAGETGWVSSDAIGTFD
jgi:oxygen tolerance protein BatD/SH3 domain-containing protein